MTMLQGEMSMKQQSCEAKQIGSTIGSSRVQSHVAGWRSVAALVLGVSLAGCVVHAPRSATETVYRISAATWLEDVWSSYDVSPDGAVALYRGWFSAPRFVDLPQGLEDAARLGEELDEISWAVFDDNGRVIRQGRQGEKRGWFLDGEGGDRALDLPADGLPRWSPDGSAIACELGRELKIGTPDNLRSVSFDGHVVGIAWAPDSAVLYALIFDPDGSSCILRVWKNGRTEPVRCGLDASWSSGRLAVSPDGRFVYVALVSDAAPDKESRHRPDADRDTDIYALELATGELRAVVTEPGDDFYPVRIGEYLYWTHNEFREEIVVVSLEGGEARVLLEDAQYPYWSHDGKRISFTVGDWRIADAPLNLDAAVIDVDANGRPRRAPQPLVVGYHEDFTPVWSFDGRWMAYHSHRSQSSVPSYGDPGGTDDIYLRGTAPGSEEIRLTDFGWEAGNPDWAPDSRRLIFDSQGRNGTPGASQAWIVNIDPLTGRPLQTEKLETPPGPAGFRVFSWSPTAEEIAATYPVGGTRRALAVVSLTDQSFENLVEFDTNTLGGLDWTPDGQRIVFSALDKGHMQLLAIARTGGEAVRLTRDSDNLIQPQVSPDGRWIAATRIHRAKELRRLRQQ